MNSRRPTRLSYLWASLADYERLALAAEQAESYVAAVQARARAVATRDAIDEIEAAQRASKRRKPRSPEEHRAEVLADARRLRAAASAAGSYVAAASLLRVEGDLLAAAATGTAPIEAMSTEELEAELARLRAERDG